MKVFLDGDYDLLRIYGISCNEDENEGFATLSCNSVKMHVYREGNRTWRAYYKGKWRKFDCISSVLNFVIVGLTI